MAHHLFLALACAALLGTIAAQDFMWKPLRNKTISAGLTGPYHVLLDASYIPLAVALCMAFNGWMEVFAIISAIALLLVATTNTAWKFVDSITGGQHAKWHTRFTLVVFVSALLLQVFGDRHLMWALTALNLIVPAIAYVYFHYCQTDIDGVVIAAIPAAEKLYVAGLCIWLIVWTL